MEYRPLNFSPTYRRIWVGIFQFVRSIHHGILYRGVSHDCRALHSMPRTSLSHEAPFLELNKESYTMAYSLGIAGVCSSLMFRHVVFANSFRAHTSPRTLPE